MPALTGQTIAEAQGAVRALLDHVLVASGLDSTEYVALRVADSGRAKDDLAGFLASQRQLGLDRTMAEALVHRLEMRGLICSGSITPTGMALYRRVQDKVTSTTTRLYEDLDEQDLATAHRVLTAVIARAAEIRLAGS